MVTGGAGYIGRPHLCCQDYGIEVVVYDPWADTAEAEHEYGVTPIRQPDANAL